MPIVAVIGNKGGVGKTTLCLNLAAALGEKGRAVILDADQQRSSSHWYAVADQNDAVPVVDSVDDLSVQAHRHADSHDYVVIDCPPSVVAPQTREALTLCDLALAPVLPSPIDLWATVQLEEEIQAASKLNPALRAVLVINQLEPRTRLSQLMRQALAELNLPAAQTAIRRRMAYRSSVLEGRTVLQQGQRAADAAEEIRQLAQEVIV